MAFTVENLVEALHNAITNVKEHWGDSLLPRESTLSKDAEAARALLHNLDEIRDSLGLPQGFNSESIPTKFIGNQIAPYQHALLQHLFQAYKASLGSAHIEAKEPRSICKLVYPALDILANELTTGNIEERLRSQYGKEVRITGSRQSPTAISKFNYAGSMFCTKSLSAQPSGTNLEQFENEKAIARQLQEKQHTNIIDFLLVIDGMSFSLYMEVGQYDLQTLYEAETLNSELVYKVAIGTFQGLAYLHNIHIAHRDIKAMNLIISSDHQIKIADFGLAGNEDESFEKLRGTVKWLDPYVVRGIYYPIKLERIKIPCHSDMYSAGLVCWEMLHRQIPYKDVADSDRLIAARDNPEGSQLQFARECSARYEPFIATIQKAWLEPESRPTAEDIANELTTQTTPDAAVMTGVRR